MPETICLVEPISTVKLAVLQAYAEGRAPAPEPSAGAVIAATRELVGEGRLQRTERGVLVTPEGLAALLDDVPVEFMRTASRSED
jgi:hypothetical protein